MHGHVLHLVQHFVKDKLNTVSYTHLLEGLKIQGVKEVIIDNANKNEKNFIFLSVFILPDKLIKPDIAIN